MEKRTVMRSGRLRRLAAAFAAFAAAVVPGIGRAASAGNPAAIEARCGRAEAGLARAMARADEATLRRFACDCAARVVPLYERAGLRAEIIRQALSVGAHDAWREMRVAPDPAAPKRALPFDVAFAANERAVHALEATVAAEATVRHSARFVLGHAAFSTIERRVSRLERELEDGTGDGAGEDGDRVPRRAPLRLLAVAMPAAEAIDEALLVAAGGSIERIHTMRDAIAEAVYLDTLLEGQAPRRALRAVFRELAWQRRHLRRL